MKMGLSKYLKIGVIILIVITFVLNFYQAYRLAIIKNWADSETYLLSGKALIEGTHPYITDAHWRYLYPLTLATILSPFAYIPEIVFISAWYCLSFTALLFSILKINKFFKLDLKQNYQVLLAVNLLFVSIIQSDFMYGQINSIILFLIIYSIELLLKNRNIGSILFGLSVSIKLMPIVLTPFLLKFGYKKAIIFIFSLFIFIIALPYFLGGSEIFDYYDYWLNKIIINQVSSGDSSSESFALAGGLANLFGLDSASSSLKLISGIFLLSFPLYLSFKKNLIESIILAISLIPLTGTKSEAHHLIFLIPNSILIIKYLLNQNFIFNIETLRNRILAWLLLILIQMMILWGNKVELFPLDALGILMLYFLGFWLILRKSTTQHF